MTEAQKTTAKQIIKDYEDLFNEKPITVDMGDREIILKEMVPFCIHTTKKLKTTKYFLVLEPNILVMK